MKHLLALIAIFVCWSGGAWAADTDEAKIAEYTALWKTALAEYNGVSEEALAPLIKVDKTEISTWNSGKTFVVDYTITMDWLTITRRDKFMVWINDSERQYGELDLPPNSWLSGPDLKKVIAKGHGLITAAIGHVDPKIKLDFASLDEAKAFVCKENKLASLGKASVAFHVPGKMPHDDGMPYLLWSAVLSDKENKLLTGYLNLVTKNGKSWEDAIRKN